jgi:glycerophosphoryl diester phosphodiesterase
MRPRLRSVRQLVLAIPFLALGACITDEVQIIAHRGASHDAPEHTFAAYDLAIERRADWIEQDLQMTRDGHLVVLHDDSLDRTATGPAANCRGLVRERTLAELQTCEVGSWFNREHPPRARAEFGAERIPTLDSVLTHFSRRARFYIETKNPAEAPGMEDSLLVLLRRHGLVGRGSDEGRIIVQSFSAASLIRLHALEPRVALVQLIDERPAGDLALVLDSIAKYAIGVGPSREFTNEAFVKSAHERGLVVHPYTVNSEATMLFLLNLGVDGMFTDRPDLLRSVLGR